MEINQPDVLGEVTAAFAQYEATLISNDVATLDSLFWSGPHTIRHGIGENLYGPAEIAAFRAGRSPVGLARALSRTQITSYGRNTEIAATLFSRETTPDKIGRQMQTWMRFPKGWLVVAAHMSVI